MELSVVEQRYRAVLAVEAAATVSEVARQVGVSRQTLHAWLARYRQAGLGGLVDRSKRPDTCPHQVSAELEAAICELRREHPRWGPRRLQHELGRCGRWPSVPARMTSTGSWSATASSSRARAADGGRTTGAGSARRRWRCGNWTSSMDPGWPTAPRPGSSPGSMTTPATASSRRSRPGPRGGRWAWRSRARWGGSGCPKRSSPTRQAVHRPIWSGWGGAV